MAEIPSIDLHPDKLPVGGPEAALAACRRFLDESLRRGFREVRIITGVGIHGDGTPRLRSRVEREVLGSYYLKIASQHYEQGGAVIRLELRPGSFKPDKAYQKKHEKQVQHAEYVRREERLQVAYERLESAEGYFDERDLKKTRMKLNQINREFFPNTPEVAAEVEALKLALREVKKKIDALP